MTTVSAVPVVFKLCAARTGNLDRRLAFLITKATIHRLIFVD
jgi:hypothetical protein